MPYVLGQAFGQTAIRFGSAVSIYFALLRILESDRVKEWLNCVWEGERVHSFLAGAMASTGLWLLPPSFRWAWVPYLLARAVHCLYEQQKAKSTVLQSIDRWLDLVVFSLSTGQLLYVFAIRTSLLDPDYKNFLFNVVALDARSIQAIQHLCSGGIRTNDFDRLEQMMNQQGLNLPLNWALRHQPVCVDCELLHPGRPCLVNQLTLYPKVLRYMGPIYLAQHLVPVLLFKFPKFLNHPLSILQRAILNALRSASFMAAFVQIFHAVLCIHRGGIKLGWFGSEQGWLYFLQGVVGSLGLLVESKSRRPELALYVTILTLTRILGSSQGTRLPSTAAG